jgi:hypothetical protein
VPIPQTIMQELTAQLEVVKKVHDGDLAAGYSGVFRAEKPPGFLIRSNAPLRDSNRACYIGNYYQPMLPA